MSSNIILNKNHIVGSNNNKLEYVFPQPISFNSEKYKPKIALSQLHIYNSWYNVNSSMYNNHKFSYKWWDMNGDLTETHDVLLPNGSYSVADIYEFLQKTSNKIINQVKGVNRVVYDISSKPPATIEWE